MSVESGRKLTELLGIVLDNYVSTKNNSNTSITNGDVKKDFLKEVRHLSNNSIPCTEPSSSKARNFDVDSVSK